MSTPPPSGSHGPWGRLSTTTKLVFAAVSAVIVTAGGLFAIIGNPFAPDPREAEAMTDPAAVAAYKIAQCRKAHRLGNATVVEERTPRRGLPTRMTFRRCDWPPLTSGSGDGFSEIDDHVLTYPDRSAAGPFNALHTIKAPCERLSVSFVLTHMSSRSYRDAVVRPGPLYLVNTHGPRRRIATIYVRKLEQVPIGVTLPPPDRGGFFILLDGHMELLHARCVRR